MGKQPVQHGSPGLLTPSRAKCGRGVKGGSILGWASAQGLSIKIGFCDLGLILIAIMPLVATRSSTKHAVISGTSAHVVFLLPFLPQQGIGCYLSDASSSSSSSNSDYDFVVILFLILF